MAVSPNYNAWDPTQATPPTSNPWNTTPNQPPTSDPWNTGRNQPPSSTPAAPQMNPPLDAQPLSMDDILNQITSQFQNTPYANIPSLKEYASHFIKTDSQGNPVGKDGNPLKPGETPYDTTGNQLDANRIQGITNGVKAYVNTFDLMFKDKVGRAPTADEFDTFFNQIVIPDKPWETSTSLLDIGQQTQNTLSNFFTKAAQDQATQNLQNLSTSAVAPGSAFDQWQQAYSGSIDTVQNSLLDYQQRLMDKIRPQLITSLQSQGLLNTGGLNEAFAGISGDLASTGSNYVAGLRGQAVQDIANQKYQIQSNPSNYQVGNAVASVPNMQAGGQTALNNIWSNYMNNNNFQNQLTLANANRQEAPSLLQQYGGMILGGAAGGFGQGLGKWAMA